MQMSQINFEQSQFSGANGNGLLPSGNKPLPEPMSTHADLCHHKASLGHNELTHCGPVAPYGNTDLGQHQWVR